ncbi:TPA: hypothetical protein ACH3X2_007045 [Trebouxia sp. C0005]
MAAMNIRVQDSCDDVLALPAPVHMAAADDHVGFPSEGQGFTSGLITAPTLYDSSGSISSIPLAWSEWSYGSTTIAKRVKQIKADPLWCWVYAIPTYTKRIGTCLSSLSL